MKVLILGGTGMIGPGMARGFHDAGHEVALFTRTARADPDLPPHRALRGDRSNPADLAAAAAVAAWDLVIDNVAFNAADVRGALAAFPNAHRYVLCSSEVVYRFAPSSRLLPAVEDAVDFDARPPDEDPRDPGWAYARGKLEAERVLRDQSPVPWTVLRPAIIHGPRDPAARGNWYVARVLAGGPILLADGGTASFRLAFSTDVARAVVLAATAPEAEAQAYNLAQSEVLTLRDFIADQAAVLGVTPDFLGIPREFVGPLGGPFADLVNHVPDASRIRRELGFQPTPWADFARTTALACRDRAGTLDALLATRAAELDLAARWRAATASLAPDNPRGSHLPRP